MSTAQAALIVLAVLTVSLAGTYELIDRAQRRESTRDRIIREAHERAELARHMDPVTLARAAAPADPAWDAGMERLWDAIRDNHTTTEGDHS